MGMLPPLSAFLAITLMAVITIFGNFLGGAGDVLDARQESTLRNLDGLGSAITVDFVSASGATVTIDVQNVGRVALRDFDSWDVWTSFHETDDTYHAERLAYSASAEPSVSQWAIENFYLNTGGGAAEASQPGILDPQEVVRIQFQTADAGDAGKENNIVVSTPRGVRATATW